MADVLSLFRSVVVLKGTIPERSFFNFTALSGIPVIAADGAAWILSQKGIAPDIIVGDLDSLKKVPDYKSFFPDTEIIEESCQESNDFEKALRYIKQHQLAPVLVIGMQGGDLEHSFNNWSVSMKMCKEIEIWILEDDRVGISLMAGGYVSASIANDKIVSLIPQPEALVSTEGLKWQLIEEKLALGIREGARNEVIRSDFSVTVHSGSLNVFMGLNSDIINYCSGIPTGKQE